VSVRAAATHCDAGTAKLFPDCAPMNAQLGSDLAQGPALGIQVDRPLNVHCDTITSLATCAALLRSQPAGRSLFNRDEHVASSHGSR
jgi:hypothetical protein